MEFLIPLALFALASCVRAAAYRRTLKSWTEWAIHIEGQLDELGGRLDAYDLDRLDRSL